jgi:uncharacterized protein YbcV (DUF1398 family)
MNIEVMHEVALGTQRGNLTFPEAVGRLLAIGVESYCVDLILGTKTYYMIDGRAHMEPMILPLDPVAGEFSAGQLIEAIRGAQADTVRYPEFVKRSTAAGVGCYWAYLTGRRAVYLSRKGEIHVEEFPRPQA